MGNVGHQHHPAALEGTVHSVTRTGTSVETEEERRTHVSPGAASGTLDVAQDPQGTSS